jgi:hypothetical protein
MQLNQTCIGTKQNESPLLWSRSLNKWYIMVPWQLRPAFVK